MPYNEFLPHPLLRSTVECYWSVRGKHTGSWTVYPDTCMDIIFNFEDIASEIVGTMFTPVQAHVFGDTDIFGIRFRAAGISRILRSPLSEFNDISLSLDSVYNSGPEVEQLYSLSNQQRVHTLDRWLLKQMTFTNSKPEAWEHCLNTIVDRNGMINIYDLSREVGISQKQMERKFVEKVGPTPKQFAQLLKFRKLKEHLSKSSGENLIDIAFDFDFTDSAHLTKFFRKFSGTTPTEFCRENTKV